MVARSASSLPLLQTIGRIYLIGLGALAVLWGIQVLPTVWRESKLERVARQIIEGQIYQPRDLVALTPIVDNVERSTFCRPASLRSAAIIRLRLTEEAIKAADQPNIDKTFAELISSIHNSLKCAPADSFLWLVLFWADTKRHGVTPHDLDDLRLSYELGPFEGWVALKRSPISLSLFAELPPEIAKKTLAEFVGLVNSGFYHEAAEILVGPGWPWREKILPRLDTIDLRHRIAFENEVHKLGYDVKVPGVVPPEARPWRR
jgi:hypothetical protein